jgi:magnesium transporter
MPLDPESIKNLSDAEKWAVLAQSSPSRAAHELKAKPDDRAAELTNEIGVAYMQEIVMQLGSDSAADLLRNLPEDFSEKVIGELAPPKATAVREILSHPAGTAGSIMATEHLSVPVDMNVADALAFLHMIPQERKGAVPYVYIVDAQKRPVGVVRTHDLIFNPLDRPLAEMMHSPVITVRAEDPKQEVAKKMQAYGYLALPVVDGDHRLVGVIPADNAILAVREQADRDITKMVGTGAEELKSGSITKIMGLRLPWLMFSICSGLFCAYISEIFQHGGQTVATLFIFVPVILGISESSGIQGATIVVRSASMGNISSRDIRNLFVKEVFVGLLIGLICALIVGVVTSFWQKDSLLGIAIGASMNVAVFVSALIGLALPLVFRAMRIDPALASGPLVLAICDIQTLFVYFNLANYILTR